jgi:two-component system, chemotaxis family, protein-glutamate methylesterase/glutaminase
MPRIRVLVVDDAVVMRKMIAEALGGDAQIEVVGTAANGHIALQKITQVNPDILTLDIEMPEMDGLQTVRELRKIYPKLPVIMFSTLTLKGADATLEALALGATDYVTKPSNVGNFAEGLDRLKNELIPKIKAHCKHITPPPSLAPATQMATPANSTGAASRGVAKPTAAPAKTATPAVLCIGCSTGGPNALATVFKAINRPLPVPVVIVQHMPPLFTQMLAERLGKDSPLQFHEGQEGQLVEAGHVYIAPGGRHMEVRREGTQVKIHLHEGPPENSCRPAVDVLFRSVATVYGGATVALIMTGMGQDGLHGCTVLREYGATILDQDEATSVVWGMPGYVAEAGLAHQILPLQDIAGALLRLLPASRP